MSAAEPDVGISAKHWLPCEANPEIMQDYVERLGAPLRAAGLVFSDVLGVDEELLAMVPQPTVAVVLLFPVSAASEAHREAEEAVRVSTPQNAPFLCPQRIDNACGTLALIHVVASLVARGVVTLAPGSFFAKFFAETWTAAPEARAAALDASDELDAAHLSLALEGQSAVVDDTHLHFLALVQGIDGQLWELDGRKAAPIPHGPTSPATLLADAVRVIKEFMARDPSSVRFAMVSLGPPVDDD